MSRNHSLNRRSFLKLLAASGLAAPFVTRDLVARPPNSRLHHASFGASGMAWADLSHLASFPDVELVAVADVDLAKTAQVRKNLPHARIYQDWREMLEKEAKRIDSVNVSTPDHMHAPIAYSAMQLGKHAYIQKPLAHDLYEVRRLTEFARQQKVVTQMGIQIHSTSPYRLAATLVQAGAIGRVKEVHSWCPKSWGDPKPLPDRRDPVPEGLDWDLWLGVCAERPFIADGYYHPANWRSRLDFGTGTFGDMGCHIFDPVFKALELQSPFSVRSFGPAPNQWNWALDSKIEYTFPGTRFTAAETFKLTWYDGAQKPSAEILALLEGDEMPNTGSIFVGSHGTMVLPHINRPLLYPDAKFKHFKYPEVPGEDHWRLFVDACLGRGTTSANLDYSGPLTQAVLLGGVASRFPQATLSWDASRQQFGSMEANAYIRRDYRSGWHVQGLG